MPRSRRPLRAADLAAAASAGFALFIVMAAPAAADTIGAGEASAFGGTITLAGEELVSPTPVATATLPADASETTIDIPAEPLAVSGTLNADASVHAVDDLESSLAVVTQAVEGPYNAKAVGSVEEAEVLVDAVQEDVSPVTADVLRAEAVAVCRGGEVEYAANSEIINLNIGGQDVPLNDPLQQVIDGLNDALEQTTLNQVVDIERNVITESADGIAVDALVVTLLAAAGDDPVVQVRLGHAEINGVSCGAAAQCSDGIDNADGEDELADADDPGCHTDGDASTPEGYDPADDDETDTVDEAAPSLGVSPSAPTALPVTGGDAASTAGLGAAMAGGALAIVALRRRFV